MQPVHRECKESLPNAYLILPNRDESGLEELKRGRIEGWKDERID